MSKNEKSKRTLPSIKELENFRKTSVDNAQSINEKLTSILGAAEELWEHVDRKDFFATEQIEMIIRTVDKIKSSIRKIEKKNAQIVSDEEEEQETATVEGEAKAEILLAEDDEDNRNVLKIMMEKMNYDVKVTKNGEQAWQEFNDNNYQALVTDVQMPGLTGLELLEKVHEKDKNTPVVLVTAYDKEAPQEIARRKENVYFIRKPFRKNKLESILEEVH